ncbi:hypothetical protein [Larkinella humicola]|uniref:Tetratricopeptide repeat protein n=1 Tax=Larkinella humicola TaxID=2607654 RepID=A0A5N1J5J7_9BACT|nr:hypothetical protein [Larkinella humicola]KAA9345473.1 hypothetical protein F0P93_29935 [Larkinella humicola]
MEAPEKKKKKLPVLSDTVIVSLFLLITFCTGIVFVWVGVYDTKDGKPLTAVLWSLACFVLGALIGFLFGIPRVLQGNPPPPPPPSGSPAAPLTAPPPPPSPPTLLQTAGYDLRVNTNLEQISDWLTKIIVGLGLVELRTVPARLKSAAGYIARGIGPGTDYFAAGLVVYFTILGFMGAYLITRLYIAGAFGRADRAASKQEEQDLQRVENIQLPALGRDEVLSDDDKKAAKNVASKPLAELESPNEISVWAKAQLSLGNYVDAVKGYGKAIGQLGEDPEKRYAYATALYYSGAKDLAFVQLLEAYKRLTAASDKTLRRNVYRSLTYQALFQDPPKGFDDAIRFGEEYVRDHQNLVSPGVWANLAAAYGQKMKWLLANNPADQTALDTTRSRALAVVQQAAGMGERWKKKIREMMDKNFPNKDPNESDLEVFAEDEDFRKLVGL